MNARDLTGKISSRICHDLISPIGAIVNGLDLIREIGNGDMQDELSMISQSATRASSLLQFYRVAFGAAEPDGPEIARSNAHDQASRLFDTQRVILDWATTGGPPLSRREACLLYRMILCAKSIVSMRGVITVQLGQAQTMPMTIRITGNGGAPLNSDLTRHLEPSARADIDPRLVEFPLTGMSAHELGCELNAEGTDQVTTLTCSYRA